MNWRLSCIALGTLIYYHKFSWRVEVRAAVSHLQAIRLVKASFLRSGLLRIRHLSVPPEANSLGPPSDPCAAWFSIPPEFHVRIAGLLPPASRRSATENRPLSKEMLTSRKHRPAYPKLTSPSGLLIHLQLANRRSSREFLTHITVSSK
ncbi:hypothetical protein XENORESO_012454 [Xenotaenia resolanae]|uniref:Uncharacterized protein n=1 Tax=Xenotaenia resolanae TaxID=208358 RepID=A0ABV0X893_9TELE